MIRNTPTPEYFQFEANGYQCAVGVETNDENQGHLVMVKTFNKVASTQGLTAEDYEYVLKWFDVDWQVNNGNFADERAAVQAFLDAANPLLATATGGSGIPPFPNGTTERLVWLVRYKLSFDGTKVNLAQ